MDGVTVFEEHAGEYDRWFDLNQQIYQAEVDAVRRFIPQTGLGLEVGVGTGRFSTPFGIKIGVEPSQKMAQIAKSRDIAVAVAFGEGLPFADGQFDFALLVTVVCFVEDVARLLREVRRVIKLGGEVIVGFIDKESPLGQVYQARKETDNFYQVARFYSTPEIAALVGQAGFTELQYCQTIIGLPEESTVHYPVRAGCGQGAFVVVRARKSRAKMARIRQP